MKKALKILFIISTIIFLAGSCTGTPRDGTSTKVYDKVKSQLSATQEAKYEGEDGRSALEILKEKYTVETKEFTGIGEFVTSINGLKAEDNKNFWAFYVNGKQANEGAGSYKTKNGDIIEWKLEKINSNN